MKAAAIGVLAIACVASVPAEARHRHHSRGHHHISSMAHEESHALNVMPSAAAQFAGLVLTEENIMADKDILAKLRRSVDTFQSPPFPPLPEWVINLYKPLIEDAIKEIERLRRLAGAVSEGDSFQDLRHQSRTDAAHVPDAPVTPAGFVLSGDQKS